MKPIFQTKMGNVEGNCFAASVSSIMEWDIAAFPELPNDKTWHEVANNHMKQFGYYFLFMDDAVPRNQFKGYHLIIGKNEVLNCDHCVVGYNGKIVHDPSGSETKLKLKYFGFIVKIIE